MLWSVTPFRISVPEDADWAAPESSSLAGFAEFGLQTMASWPKYSPDINPQENVWSWVEQALRKEEQRSDTLAVFCRKLLHVAKRYPGAAALIPSMQKRMQEELRCKGGMTNL